MVAPLRLASSTRCIHSGHKLMWGTKWLPHGPMLILSNFYMPLYHINLHQSATIALCYNHTTDPIFRPFISKFQLHSSKSWLELEVIKIMQIKNHAWCPCIKIELPIWFFPLTFSFSWESSRSWEFCFSHKWKYLEVKMRYPCHPSM